MTTQNRINDILSTGHFSNTEIEHEIENLFRSIEYCMIRHLTNAEIYYAPDELIIAYEEADLIEDTPQGRIYCFS